MRDFLAISIAAIIGANLRYFLSRLAAREFGLIFPSEHLSSTSWEASLLASS